MDPLSIAMLASSILKYNTDIQQKARQGVFDATVTRGGQWSQPEMRSLAAEHPDRGNLWGDLAAGATAASKNEQGIKADQNNSALIAALTGGSPQGQLNFDVPGGGEDESSIFNQLRGRGQAWATR